MNKLALCNKLKTETATPGSVLTAITGNSAEIQRLIDWIDDAYNDICILHDNWRFLRSAFTVNTVSGTQAYAPTTCTDTRISAAIGHATVGAFKSWIPGTFRIYLSSAGVATQGFLTGPHGYDDFRNQFMLGAPASQPPISWAVRPDDDAILLGPKPDAVYVVTGEYMRQAPGLTATTSEPAFDVAYHMAIVHLARRKHAEHWENSGQYDGANRAYKRILGDMERKELPLPGMAGPLA